MARARTSWQLILGSIVAILFMKPANAQAPFLPGDLVVSLGNFLSGSPTPGNPNEILEFTFAGGLVQKFPAQAPTGLANIPKADFVGTDGVLYMINGGLEYLYLSVFYPAINTWEFFNTQDQWTGAGFQYYGVATLGNTTFVTNMASPGTTAGGIFGFNNSNGIYQSYAHGGQYQSLCLGWDGLLYAINNDQLYNGVSGTAVDVFNPTTMQPVRSFILAKDPYAGDTMHSIAVDKAGGIFCVGNGGVIYHYDANLNLLGTTDTDGKANWQAGFDAYNIALSSDGKIAVSNDNGYIYLTDETLKTVTSFQVYSAPFQNTWDMFAAFVPLPTITTFGLSSSTVIGGATPTGTVTLSSKAPAGGGALQITSSNPAAVPNISGVSVAAGATSVSFPVPTNWVTSAAAVTLTATYASSSSVATLSVKPVTVSTFKVSPSPITGGISTSGTITLTGPAPTGGEPVSWTSSNTAAIPNGTATVLAGQTTATFPIATKPVTATQSVKLTASLNGTNVVSTVSVIQSAVASFTATPSPITGGKSITGTIHLTAPAPTGGAVVKLTSNLATAIPIQASVTIPVGQTEASFTMSTLAVTAVHSVTLAAALNGVDAYAVVVVVPTAIASMSVAPATVTGGTDPTVTLDLTAPAPAGGTVVPLTSSNRAAVPIPATVTVPAGKSSYSFLIPTDAVAASQNVTLTATLYGSATAALTVNPPAVSGFTLSSGTVKGGTSITGTLNLNCPAPIGGIAVALASSNKTAVPITASVKVLAGKSTISFTIPTDKVTANTNVTLTATLNGSETAKLTVTP